MSVPLMELEITSLGTFQT